MTHTQNLIVMRAFGNSLDALINETLLPLSMSRLKAKATMLDLVEKNTSDEAKKVGEVIRVPKPVKLGAAKVHGDRSTATDLVTEAVDVRLDKHMYQSFKLSDREFTGMMPGAIPSALESAVDSLAIDINASVIGKLRSVAAFSGKLDSTNARTKKDMINAKTKMNKMKIGSDRFLVLCSETEGDLLGEFTAGSDQKAETEGLIGRRFGFNVYNDIMLEDHTAGTAAGTDTIVTAAFASVGSKVLVISGANAGDTINQGDVLVIAGQSFAVATDVELVDGTGAVSIANAVEVAIEAGSSVKVVGDHRFDVAFTREAVTVVFRQLETPIDTSAVSVGQMTDPDSGVSMRMMAYYDGDSESTTWKVEVFYGVEAVAPERAIRVGGH